MSAREGKGIQPIWAVGPAIACAMVAGTAQAALVTVSGVVTNNTSTTQSYEIKRSIPVTDPIAQAAIRGSMSMVVSDFNGDGAVLTSDAGNLYSGWLNSSRVKTFVPLNNVTNFQVAAGSMGMNSFTGDYGSPTSESIGRALAMNDIIEIRFNFRLSAGDQAIVTGTFEFLPVPGPSAFAATLLAPWIGLHRRRRTENAN